LHLGARRATSLDLVRQDEGMSVETIAFEPVGAAQAADPLLREQLLDTWVDVTNAGGAVGFTPPADRVLIAETLDAALERIVGDRDRLGVLRRADGTARGMGILAASSSQLRQHWRTVLRLMVHPDLQGQGAGRVLLEGLHGIGSELGLEFVILTVRGGTGIEDFYAHLGYTEFGRNPHAIRLAPGDERDEIHMRRAL
jgi:GNAT superfamily N-acetyltransferase